MLRGIRNYVFRLYEQTVLRNWFYTLSFAIIVPTGCRFAIVAWQYGEWFDKPLAVLAGTLIGVTSLVTLLRVWEVPPQQTTTIQAVSHPYTHVDPEVMHINRMSESKRLSAMNRRIAREAAALGTTVHRH